jgi:hypothetical protein
VTGRALAVLAGCAALLVAAFVVVASEEDTGGRSLARAGPTDPAARLRPPAVDVLKRGRHLADGLIFLGPKPTRAATPEQVDQQGLLIVDERGRPVWFRPLPRGVSATGLRVQRYRGKPVLTWAQGKSTGGPGHSKGVDVIADSAYHVIARIRAGNGLDADQHEFLLTPYGTALISSYNRRQADLSPVGGPADGTVYEGVVQEIDLATGRVVFEWHSLDHVSLDESFHALPRKPGIPWDYFHLNSINLDRDGNLLISARQTSAVYKIDHRIGRVIWRLGGKRSDFAPGPGVHFAYQHDAQPAGGDTVRIFDNHSNGQAGQPVSRVIWVRLDPGARRATLLRSVIHPGRLSVGSQGNAQALPDRHLFVAWGSLGRVSEFNQRGRLLFDAALPSGYETYRAYRSPWVGRPSTRPQVGIAEAGVGLRIDAIWNGATEVARWRILGGSSPGSLSPLGAARWNGLETAVEIGSRPRYVQAVAENASGRVIGRSRPVPARR